MVDKVSEASLQGWSKFYLNPSGQGILKWPADALITMMCGSVLPGFPAALHEAKVLEVGFGSGNNLAFFHTHGCSLSGVEIAEEICASTKERLACSGISANLKVGTNINIPFEEDSFDIIVSWNAIHYEGSLEGFRSALQEYGRVLKSGGRIVVSTVAPRHMILRGANELGECTVGLSNSDFRRGERFCVFPDSSRVIEEASRNFKDVSCGRLTFELGDFCHDAYLISGRK